MEHLLTSSYCSIELVGNQVDVKCGMIRKYVDDNTDAILLCLVKHDLHLLLGSKDVVSDRPVCRLVIVIPVSFLLVKDLDVSALRTETCVDRRCLDHGESCICNLLHVLSDGWEVPAPYMEDGFRVSCIRVMCHSVHKARSRRLRRACRQHQKAGQKVKCLFHYHVYLFEYQCKYGSVRVAAGKIERAVMQAHYLT